MRVLAILFATFILNSSLQAASRPVSDADRKELEEWGSRRYFGRVLLTPPVGKIDPQVQQARDHIKQMLDSMAGSKLRAMNANIVVNIYASEKKGASVANHHPDYYQELRWRTNHPNEAWPIRRMLGFEGNDRPIHEIRVTTGLLQFVEYEAELAFILGGHEIKHILEGHDKPMDENTAQKEIAEYWWRMQSDEVVADNGGLEMMVGHFDLVGALMTLRRFAEAEELDPDRAEWRDAIQAGASTHHHDGVRIALAQFMKEYLLRYNPQAAPRGLTRLPDFFKLLRAERGRSYERFSAAEVQQIEAALDRHFIGNNEYPLLTHGGNSSQFKIAKALDPTMHALLMTIEKSPGRAGDFFWMAFHRIDRAEITSSQKVTALMMVAYLLSRYCGYAFREAINELTNAQVDDLTFWLRKHSIKGNWQISNLSQRLTQTLMSLEYVGGFEGRYYDNFDTLWFPMDFIFMSSVNGQEILSGLMKVHEGWRIFFEALTRPEYFHRSSASPSAEVIAKFRGEGSIAKGPLYADYFRNLIRSVSQMPFDELIFWAMQGDFWYNLLAGDLERLKQNLVQNAKDDLGSVALARDINQTYVDQNLSLTLNTLKHGATNWGIPGVVRRPRRPDVTERTKALVDLIGLIENNVIDPRQPEIVEAYLAFVNVATTGRFLGIQGLDVPVGQALLELTSAIVSNPTIALAERKNALKFLGALNGVTRDLQFVGFEKAETAKTKIAQFLRSLTPAEYIELVINPLESFENHLNSHLATIASMTPDARKEWQNRWGFFPGYQFTQAAIGQNFGVVLITKDVGAADIFQQYDYKSIRQLILGLNRAQAKALEVRNAGLKVRSKLVLNYATTEVLINALVARLHEAPSFHDWMDTYERALKLTGSEFMLADHELRITRLFVESELKKMPLSARRRWLEHASVMRIVSNEFVAAVLNESLRTSLPRRVSSQLLANRVQALQRQFKLQEKHPDAFVLFRNQATVDFNVQPDQIDIVFPEDQRTATEKANGVSGHVRGMSSFVAMTRKRSHAEQIEMIDYLMGRRPDQPAFVADVDRQFRSDPDGKDVLRLISVPPISHGVQALRNEVTFRTELERAVVVAGFLSGKGAIINDPQGLKAVLEHILKNVRPEKLWFARKLADGLMAAEGEEKSFILSFILAQKPGPNGELDEENVLNAFLQFYGAPGVKAAQYLALVEEFAEYRNLLEASQDEALPISDYTAVRLLATQFGSKWDPSRYRYIQIKGSGSVSIGIEYEDLQTGKRDIATVLREEIETKTSEDFRRFHKLVKSLIEDSAERDRFEFLIGLLRIIERSVALEFNKQHTYQMQKFAETLYNKTVNGWQVRTVTAYEALAKGLFMSQAPGVGARHVLKADPAVYREAMAALLSVEDEILRGIDPNGTSMQQPSIANPDLHNGQVLIDKINRIVTIIDFGQALPISNEEREFALDLLRIASSAHSLTQSYEILMQHARNFGFNKAHINVDDLHKVLTRKDRMDIFVHLISLLERSGFEVPLSAVHWVLGVNRVLILSRQIGQPLEPRYRNLVLARRFGLSLQTYNRVHHKVDSSNAWISTRCERVWRLKKKSP